LFGNPVNVGVAVVFCCCCLLLLLPFVGVAALFLLCSPLISRWFLRVFAVNGLQLSARTSGQPPPQNRHGDSRRTKTVPWSPGASPVRGRRSQSAQSASARSAPARSASLLETRNGCNRPTRGRGVTSWVPACTLAIVRRGDQGRAPTSKRTPNLTQPWSVRQKPARPAGTHQSGYFSTISLSASLTLGSSDLPNALTALRRSE
jgi:hypothetical protein